MPSPRKRRIRRAQAAVMGTQKMSADQKADSHFVEQLVRMHAYAVGKPNAPFAQGGAIDSVKPLSGLISDLGDMAMNATAKLVYDAAPAAGEFVQFTDGVGLSEMFVFLAARMPL